MRLQRGLRLSQLTGYSPEQIASGTTWDFRPMQRTYETRLPRDPVRDPLFSAYADLYGRAERTLFARLRAGEPSAPLKRALLAQFGLTARQFNALACALRGKIASIQRSRPVRIDNLERRSRRAKKVLARIPRGSKLQHQKRRRLGILEQRLRALREDRELGRVRLCFGSRTLFHRQFALAANGYPSHQAWLTQWRASRSNQFFVVGSKDETAGCQGCVATIQRNGLVILRLRLPNRLASTEKFIKIPDLRFAYGNAAIAAAIGRNLSSDEREHEAISWRFVRDRKGWRVLATVSVPPGARHSAEGIGVVAVDLNADHLAVTELDRAGNPIAALRVPCLTQGVSRHRCLAAIGDAVKQVVSYARLRFKPVVAEALDFEREKAEVENKGARFSHVVSGFAYATFHAILRARTYDAGIALRLVNPAYTSVIGSYKFADRYGLSRHQAAALAIGRRGMRLAERPNRHMGDRGAFPLPARNRGNHVWSFWRHVARRAAAHRTRGRPGDVARSSLAPTPGVSRGTASRAIRSSDAGGTPARESSATLFG